MRQFQAAMALTGEEFSEAVQYYAKVCWVLLLMCVGAGLCVDVSVGVSG